MKKLHPRTLHVQKAASDLESRFLDWWGQHDDITFVEASISVTRLLEVVNKHALRAERHPDDPNRKADEE